MFSNSIYSSLSILYKLVSFFQQQNSPTKFSVLCNQFTMFTFTLFQIHLKTLKNFTIFCVLWPLRALGTNWAGLLPIGMLMRGPPSSTTHRCAGVGASGRLPVTHFYLPWEIKREIMTDRSTIHLAQKD